MEIDGMRTVRDTGASAENPSHPAPQPSASDAVTNTWLILRGVVSHILAFLLFQGVWGVLLYAALSNCSHTLDEAAFGWLTVFGGCSVEDTSFLEILVIAIGIMLLLNTIVLGVILYQHLLWSGGGGLSFRSMVERAPSLIPLWFLSGYLSSDVSMAVVFASLGFIPLLVMSVFQYVVMPPLFTVAVSIALPETRMEEMLRFAPHIYGLVPSLKTAATALDGATDLATSLTLGAASPIGISYLCFSIFSFAHHLVNVTAQGTAWRRTVASAAAAPLLSLASSHATTLTTSNHTQVRLADATQALRHWLSWKVFGVVLGEVPLLLLDISILLIGFSERSSSSQTVVGIGFGLKMVALLSSALLLGWDGRTLWALREIKTS